MKHSALFAYRTLLHSVFHVGRENISKFKLGADVAERYVFEIDWMSSRTAELFQAQSSCSFQRSKGVVW
jgi:hypothetical protein